MKDSDLRQLDADAKPVSLVGLSAAEFAATYDIALRHDLIRTLLRRDEHGALDLITRRNWWLALEQIAASLTFTGSGTSYIAESLATNIQHYPNIIDRLAEVQAERLAMYASRRDLPNATLAAIWARLVPRLGTIGSASRLRLIRAVLKRDIITSEDAMEYISPLIAELPSANDFSEEHFKENETLYELVPLILKGSNAQQARRIFRRLIPYQAIADSSAGYGESMHHDFVFHGPQTLYECAHLVVGKLSLTAAIAWASRTLLESYQISYRRWEIEFTGQEISGSGHSTLGNQYTYQDNGWLVKVLVPLAAKQLEHVSTDSLRTYLKHWNTFSPLHSAFRLRATILALDTRALGSVSGALVNVARRGGGLPSISDAVSCRARESQELASALLDDAIKRHGYLTNPDEAAALHRLIAEGDQKARELALRVVSHSEFGTLEDLHVGFFAQLNWATADPDFALTLLERAVSTGYRPDLFSSRYVIDLIKSVVVGKSGRDRVLQNKLLTGFMPYVVGDDDVLYAEYASALFLTADIAGKVELTRKAADHGLDMGLEVLRLALADADPVIDSDIETRASGGEVSTITGVRTTAYFELHRLYAKHGLDAYRKARFDIFEIASRECGSYGIRYAAIALSAIRDAAIRVGDLMIADRATAVVEALCGNNVHPAVQMELSDILVHHWPRLSETQKALYWSRFSYTKNGAAFAMVRALTSKAPSDVTRAKENFYGSLPDVQNYMAWVLWRRLSLSEDVRSLEDPVTAQFVAMFLSSPEEDTYNTMGRLLAHAARNAPTLALNYLIDLSYSALENDVQVFVSLDDQIDYSSASRDKALILAEYLTSVTSAAKHYGIAAFVISLLRAINEPAYTSRVKRAFEALRELPYAIEAYHEWRQRMAE